jgi:D-threo-aldose 1-dehydrogenase
LKTRSLGAFTVTELGLGGGPLGNLYRAMSEQGARSTIDAAWAAGVRYFDTAPHYGLGLSEVRLGQALRGHPRDQFVISTKVGRLLEPNPTPTGSDLAAGGFDVPDTYRRRFDFSRDGVRRSLEASMNRLGLDRVDIVYVHDPDQHVDQALTSAIPALLELREQGVVGAVGVGMNDWRVPLRIIHECELDVVMLAGRWTLLDRSGAALLDECARRGVHVVAAAPFNSGLLAQDRPPADATFNYAPATADVLTAVAELAGICADFDVPLPAAALQFPLRRAVVPSVVCGLRTPDEIRAALHNFTRPIPTQAWDQLDGLGLAASTD